MKYHPDVVNFIQMYSFNQTVRGDMWEFDAPFEANQVTYSFASIRKYVESKGKRISNQIKNKNTEMDSLHLMIE